MGKGCTSGRAPGADQRMTKYVKESLRIVFFSPTLLQSISIIRTHRSSSWLDVWSALRNRGPRMVNEFFFRCESQDTHLITTNEGSSQTFFGRLARCLESEQLVSLQRLLGWLCFCTL